MDIATAAPLDDLRWFAGSLNRVVADAGQTGGTFGLMEQWAATGFSPPLHVHHREDSALVVLDGTIEVRRGDETVHATAGDCVFLPRDVPHTFLVTSDAHFLEIVTPAGFERYHVDASDPAEAVALPPPTPPDIGRLVRALSDFDAEILGPPLSS